jgi:hypothetical protein
VRAWSPVGLIAGLLVVAALVLFVILDGLIHLRDVFSSE